LKNPDDDNSKREELKAKRTVLFERYLKHPTDTHLALQIKVIDDQIAKSLEPKARKSGSRK